MVSCGIFFSCENRLKREQIRQEMNLDEIIQNAGGENDPKIENLLNLALDATQAEREKSKELETGYDPEDRIWELIVKYQGSLEEVKERIPGIRVIPLLRGYAIFYVAEQYVEQLAAFEEITYIEKPKRLYFALDRATREACITSFWSYGERQNMHLMGNGILVAVLDSGIDYAHPDFRNADGTTRILALWDQTIAAGPAPYDYGIGTEYSRETINEALRQTQIAERERICPSRDTSGHGTHVAGIAAGNGRASEGRYTGTAPESSLLIVKLGNAAADSFPRTTQLMMALDYVVRKSMEYNMPLAVNISFGNSYGSHSGDSLLETFINDVAGVGRTVIVTGAGNEGNASGHTSGRFEPQIRPRPGQTAKKIEFAVSEYEQNFSIQIWKSYVDDIAVSIGGPGGESVGPLKQVQGPQRFRIGDTRILVYYGEPSPYSPYQEIYLDFIPAANYVDSGIWSIELYPGRIVQGEYHLWMPGKEVRNPRTGFLYPTEGTTLTIPATAAKSIAVAAYDAIYDQLADFSGRGYTRATNQIKPDLAAPGVDITAPAPGGGYTMKTGTSMAAPFVTGSAALLMQWGIIYENDSFLYGEKVKAYLLRGARQIPALNEYPNPIFGWGVLCLRDSLPE